MSDMSWAGASRYPLARRRRRSRLRWRAISPARVVAGLVLLAAAVVAVTAWRARRPDPQAAFRRGVAAVAAGRYGDAETQLTAALPAEAARAQVALARVAIEREDGPAADIALQRAAAAGEPAERLQALRAAALLLDGDTDGARREAAAAPIAFRAFADRVTARSLAQDGDVAGATRLLGSIVARWPRNAGAWRDLGNVRLGAGDVASASDAAARALAIDSAAPATLLLQARVVRTRYGPVASLPWFAEAVSRDPRFVAALVDQAATLGEVGQARSALAAARAALAARPEMAQPLYLLAVMAARADRPGLARRLLQKADADAIPGAQLLGGWLDQIEGHNDLAIAQWQRLLGAQPRNVVVRRLLAAALLRSGDPQGALDTAAPAAQRGDADSYMLEVAARAARALGRAGLAATLHDRAIGGTRQPAVPFAESADVAALAVQADEGGRADADVALVRGLLAHGDGAAAVARAQGLVQSAPGVAAAVLVLGDAQMVAGQTNAATATYATAANLAFDEPTALRIVDAAARMGRDQAAATALALFASQNPGSLGAQRIVGHWQATAGSDAALATLAGVTRATGGGETATLADLALARLQAGDTVRARALARAAYRLTPMRIDVVQVYATVLARTGDRDLAAQLTAKARLLAVGGG